jgi:hypothetical protein
MTILRIFCLLLAVAVTAFAADPTGTWKWTTRSPGGGIETTLKLESKAGKLSGAYSNQFGATAITKASLDGDAIAFEVVRNLSGKPYVVKYRGKIEGDTIKGTIDAPGHDGGAGVKLDWIATRTLEKRKSGE